MDITAIPRSAWKNKPDKPGAYLFIKKDRFLCGYQTHAFLAEIVKRGDCFIDGSWHEVKSLKGLWHRLFSEYEHDEAYKKGWIDGMKYSLEHFKGTAKKKASASLIAGLKQHKKNKE